MESNNQTRRGFCFFSEPSESTNMSKIIMTIDTRPFAREIERSVRKTACRPSFALRVKNAYRRKAKHKHAQDY